MLQEKRVLKFFSIDNGLEYVLEVLLVSSQLPTGGRTELTLAAGLTSALPPLPATPPTCSEPGLLLSPGQTSQPAFCCCFLDLHI